MLVRDIAIINPKSTHKNREYINYIDTSSVLDGTLIQCTMLTEEFPSRAQRSLEKNDILISSVRPNLKHNYLVSCDFQNLIGSTGFVQIRITSKNYNPKYLYYFLTSQPRIDYFTTVANFSQTAYPTFNKDIIENLEIPNITLNDQRHIVDTISSLLLKSL